MTASEKRDLDRLPDDARRFLVDQLGACDHRQEERVRILLDALPRITHEGIAAWRKRMREWGKRKGNETFTACGDWTVEPLGLDVLGELKDHASRLVAVHEAGHVVAGFLFGHAPAMATIEPDHETGELGFTEPTYEGDATEDGIRALVIALLAGECAALLAGEDVNTASIGADNDQTRVEGHFYFLYDTEDDRVQNLRDIREETETILRTHWSKVGLVARFLLKHTTLDEDDLINLLDLNDDQEAEEAFEDGRAMKAFLSGANIGDLTPERRAAIHRHRERCEEGGPELRRSLERLKDEGGEGEQ